MEGGLREEFGEEHRVALFDVVENLLKTDNFKVRIEPGSKKGDNFVGVVYRIIFSTADERSSSTLVLKMAPTDDMRRQTFHVRSCFLREIFMYKVILPYFRLFQESRHVPRGNGFYEYPNCYKSIETNQMESLFMQDLNEKRFTMIDKDAITVEHILLVMKSLGKLHAISFALKDQQPEKFEELVSELDESIFKTNYFLDNTSIAINSAAIDVISSITDEKDAHLLKSVLKLYEKTQYEIALECIDGQNAEPYAVVTHGDLWSNNTMFRLDDDNKPKKVCLIDWQLSRYASPVLDLVYYIFISTTRELRGRHYNNYLKTYYGSLSSHLIRLGSNPETIFPYSAFNDQLQKFGKFGLIFASFFLPIFAAKMDVEAMTENINDENMTNAPKLSDECKMRIRDIVADMYRLGYI